MSLRTATLLAGLMLAAPTAALAAPSPEIVETTQAPARAGAVETATYAEREARDQSKVESYEGGATVVIAMSGTVLVVILVLLLLL